MKDKYKMRWKQV